MFIKKDKRPDKMPKSKVKSKNINLRVTPGEHERIRTTAKSMGLNITQWLELLIFGEDK